MTTRRGLLVQVNGDYEFRQIDSYLDIRAAVGGDFDWAAPGPVNYYCYEYALFELPRNPVATALYHQTHPTVADPLCGPVLITGPVKDEDDTDVPEEIVDYVRKVKADLGEKIATLAVPLTPAEVMDFQTKMIVAQNLATEALKAGRGVDFGGAIIDPQPPTTPYRATFDSYGPIDGNRRQGGKR